MIDFFYFIALTTIDQSILIGGGVVCCQLVQPTVANETFSHATFFDDQTNNLIKAQIMILATQPKSRATNLRARLVPRQPHLVDLAIFLQKIVALQLVTFYFLSHVFSKTNWGVFNKSRPFLRLLDNHLANNSNFYFPWEGYLPLQTQYLIYQNLLYLLLHYNRSN